MIAGSTGYWRRQRVPFRYLPHGALWRGKSPPRGVFEQWRAWCLRPQYFGPDLDTRLAASFFDAVREPVLNWAFADDPIATPAAVEALLKSYPHARVERRCTAPREIGARRIGHQGFFLERHRDSLWAGVLDWLDARRACEPRASAIAINTTKPPASCSGVRRSPSSRRA